MTTLSTKHKQLLKAKAHSLKPVVMLGDKGLTEAVLKEAEIALNTHELIKVKVAGQDRDAKREVLAEMSASLKADLIQVVGNIGVLYRKKQN